MDITQNKHLGPYICVLYRVLNSGEIGKAADDKIVTGQMLGGVENNWAGSFLAWRGAPMKEEWIAPFDLNKGKEIRLSSNSSVSRSMEVALSFALDDKKPDHTPVLFIFFIRNYKAV